MDHTTSSNPLSNHQYRTFPVSYFILYGLFFISGCAGIIYQVMWQRLLFLLFGVDLESITIIVSVFMFGLGIGGLVGGKIADRWPHQLLILYVFVELAIAAFGYASPKLIMGLGNTLMTNSKIITASASFLLLAFPTLLMGATFPLLVAHVNQYYQHVGHSVGNLYCINTLGAASGAFAAGFILLSFFDVFQSIHYAALSNLMVASIAWVMFQKVRPC